MKNSLRIPVVVVAALLLLIAIFPAEQRGGQWLKWSPLHVVRKVEWNMIGLECIAAVAIGLGVWAIRSKE